MDDKEHQPVRDSSAAETPSVEAASQPGESRQPSIGVEPDQGMTQSEIVTLEYRHSLATRWMHWINFPLLFLMIYSGILIYWADSQHEGLNAHQVYRIGVGSWTLFRFFPRWFYNDFHLKYQLAQGLAYHFFFMWFFALNGVAYVMYTLLSGEWRNLVPTKKSFKGAIDVISHDLGLSKHPLSEQKFNHAQRIAYSSVVLAGAGSLLTGLAIYKPSQLHILTSLFGGYEMARWLHFWLTLSYVGFFVIHVMQVVRAGWNNLRSMVIGYQVMATPSRQKEDSDAQNTSGS